MITVWAHSIVAGKCSHETDSQGTEKDGSWSSTHFPLFLFLFNLGSQSWDRTAHIILQPIL